MREQFKIKPGKFTRGRYHPADPKEYEFSGSFDIDLDHSPTEHPATHYCIISVVTDNVEQVQRIVDLLNAGFFGIEEA